MCKEIAERDVDGKTFVFTYRLAIGQRAAKLLDVPFVYSRTKRPLAVIQENDTIVISAIGNEGLSFPVRRVIELDFLFGSGQEAGQRLGRAAYEVAGKKRPGEHHVLMTPYEYAHYGKRLLIYDQWGLDVDVRSPDTSSSAPWRPARASSPARAPRRSAPTPKTQPSHSSSPRGDASAAAEPVDEIDRTLALAPLAAKIREVERQVSRPYYLPLTLRACWSVALAAEDIALGLQSTSYKMVQRIRQCCRALVEAKLMKEDASGRFIADQDELKRLTALAGLGQLSRSHRQPSDRGGSNA